MNWRKACIWTGIACFAVGAGWFLLMAVFPEQFPFHREFAWIFAPGIGLAWVATKLGNGDEIWPTNAVDADWPISGSASHVDMDAIDDD